MAPRHSLIAVLGGCMLAPARAGCTNARWTDAYSPERCHISGDAAVVQCLGRSGAECGMRMESTFSSGMGLHSMGIKAAPGPGVVTTFYLSNNGGLYDKSCTNPWVELDYEVMGNQAGPESKIWTNMFTGTCQEHWQWITVPFDVSAGYHIYSFDITQDSVSWLVDGVAYRTESIAQHSDVRSSAQSSSFREFVSVWGKSSSDPGEGIPQFRNALGKLDENSHSFPLLAGFKRDVTEGGAPSLPSDGEGSTPSPGDGESGAPSPGNGALPAPCLQGAAPWHGCNHNHCCVEGYTCFEKNEHYAQCRPSCILGVHEDDLPAHRTPWSCAVLSPAPAPGPFPTPSPVTDPTTCSDGPELFHSCQDSKCCADGSTCFEKDAHYSQCRSSCIPGIHHEDEPKYQTPWSCRVLSPGARRLGLQFLV